MGFAGCAVPVVLSLNLGCSCIKLGKSTFRKEEAKFVFGIFVSIVIITVSIVLRVTVTSNRNIRTV